MTKKCVVKINGKELSATFYGVFQKAYTYAGGMTIGSAPAGQVSYPVAVVDHGEGLTEVNIEQVEGLEE